MKEDYLYNNIVFHYLLLKKMNQYHFYLYILYNMNLKNIKIEML